MKKLVQLEINGENFDLAISPTAYLIDVIREAVGLTGTKKGCGIGDCGACTVLIDGRPSLSCITLAMACEGKSIVTIEGLSRGSELHPVQRAFVDKGAVQCGFCTPGMVLSAVALLNENPRPTEPEIKTALAGNLCRCTGYVKIIEAVEHAGKVLSGESENAQT
jgi:carbon-monoxide dehydrogenase small subunit